jgi:putative redox protein
MVTTKMKWAGGLKFEGTGAFGHKIATDGGKQAGGQESGYKPTELMFFGLAGCAGIDVINIMEKMRQKITTLEIEVVAHQNDDYPKPFHTVEVKFIVRGENVDPDKLARAIALSEEKYCAVSQTIQIPGKVTTSYEIVT